MTCVTCPPSSTRTQHMSAGLAIHTPPSASIQMPSGWSKAAGRAAKTRSPVSVPSASIQYAVSLAPWLCATTSILPSAEMAAPLGNISVPAWRRTSPSGVTSTSEVARRMSTRWPR